MKFAQVPGQQHIKRALVQAIQSGNVPHAQLISGTEGSSGLALALAYTAYMVCEQRNEDDSCGTCAACRKVSMLQHPDLHLSFPFVIADGKETSDAYLKEWRELIQQRGPFFTHEDWVAASKAEGKSLIMNVAEAASIAKKLWLKSYEGGYKFLIIWEPESMREDASNKLLKLVEEPPDKTIILLVSEHPENVIATIRSRTQNIRLEPLSAAELTTFLKDNYQLDESQATIVVDRAGNNLARAVRLAISGGESTWFAVFRDWMRMCYSLDVRGLINWVDVFSKEYGREEQKGFLNYSLDMVRQCLSSNYTSGELQHFSAEEKDFAAKFSPFINERNALEFLEVFQLAFRDVGSNLSPKPLFLDLSIQVHRLLRKGKRD